MPMKYDFSLNLISFRTAWVATTCLLFLLGGAPLVMAGNSPTPISQGTCQKQTGKPMVYAIGSSTMGISLGPALQQNLKPRGVPFRKWGKASSGLARPDFHNWISATRDIVKERNPGVFVISLGTNDFQGIKHKGKWINPSDPSKWKAEYGRRVQNLLEAASGKDRSRVVIWVTPTVFKSRKAKKIGRWIHDIIVEKTRAFDGPAFVVDAYRATTDSAGHPLSHFRLKGETKSRPIYVDDGIHLTEDAVRYLMAEPVLEVIEYCVPGARKADR